MFRATTAQTVSFAESCRDTLRAALGGSARPVRSHRPTLETLDAREVPSHPGIAAPTPGEAEVRQVAAQPARVLAQDFRRGDDWLTGPDRLAIDKPATTLYGIVDGAKGARTIDGRSLRFQLGKGVYDPDLKRRSASGNEARYALLALDAPRYGLKDGIYLSYYVMFDRDAEFVPDTSMKLTWFNGTARLREDAFNYVLRFSNFDNFAFVNNSFRSPSVGDPFRGDEELRQKGQFGRFSTSPGARELLKGMPVKEYMRGRPIHIEMHLRLNDPGRSNGAFTLKVQGVTVMKFNNGRMRESSSDRLGEVDIIGMYGGPEAPPKFGLVVDKIEAWTGEPRL